MADMRRDDERPTLSDDSPKSVAGVPWSEEGYVTRRDDDPMTTATAEMFLRRAETAEAEVERLRAEIERGWLALGIRRNPQHDVTMADGINRLREQHAARLAEIEEE
jgi:hypothetical protein